MTTKNLTFKKLIWKLPLLNKYIKPYIHRWYFFLLCFMEIIIFLQIILLYYGMPAVFLWGETDTKSGIAIEIIAFLAVFSHLIQDYNNRGLPIKQRVDN